MRQCRKSFHNSWRGLIYFFTYIFLSCFIGVISVTFLSVLAVTWALAEILVAIYDPEESCTSDGPQTVVQKKSKLHCASACSGQLECREWNFDETTKDCSLYKHKALFFAALPGCVRYKVVFQMFPYVDT